MKKFNLKHVLSVFAFALVALCMVSTVKAQAGLSYDAMTDSVTSTEDGFIYVLKSESGNTIKGGTAGTAVSSGDPVSLTNIKLAVNKDAFLFFSKEAITENKEGVNATLKIYATTVKSAKVTVNYTCADQGANAAAAKLFNWDVTDNNKAKIDAKKLTLYWSENDKDYYTTGDAEHTLNGAYLADKLANGTTIYIRISVDAKHRVSKAVKVKIAKQAAAPAKIKLDVKKDAIGIKNGFDFRLLNVAITEDVPDDVAEVVLPWHTILPFNKAAANDKATGPIVLTTLYQTLAAKADKALEAKSHAYTPTKFASLTVNELAKNLVGDAKTKSKTFGKNADNADITAGELLSNGFYFQIRKSATPSKPASAAATFKFSPKAPNPVMYTATNVMYDQVIAEGETANFKANTIAKAPKENGGNYWTGIGAEVAPASEEELDDAAAVFEFAVVNKKDFDADKIDWSTVAWKTLKAGTQFKDGKVSTKYKLVDTTAVTAIYNGSDAAATSTGTEYVLTASDAKIKTYILIRRAGVKGADITSSKVASDVLVTWLSKKKVNNVTTIAWITSPDATVGEKGYQYTVNIVDWAKGTGNTEADKAYAWRVVDKVVGYQKATDNASAELPSIENGYYAAKASDTKAASGLPGGDNNDAVYNAEENTLVVPKPAVPGTAVVGTKEVYIRRNTYATLKLVNAVAAAKGKSTKYVAAEAPFYTFEASAEGNAAAHIIVGEEKEITLTPTALGFTEPDATIEPENAGYHYELAEYTPAGESKGKWLSCDLTQKKDFSVSAIGSDSKVTVKLDTNDVTMYVFYDEFVDPDCVTEFNCDAADSIEKVEDKPKYLEGLYNITFEAGVSKVSPKKIVPTYEPNDGMVEVKYYLVDTSAAALTDVGEDDDDIAAARTEILKSSNVINTADVALAKNQSIFAVVTTKAANRAMKVGEAEKKAIYKISYDYVETTLSSDKVTLKDKSEITFSASSEAGAKFLADGGEFEEGTALQFETLKAPVYNDEKQVVEYFYGAKLDSAETMQNDGNTKVKVGVNYLFVKVTPKATTNCAAPTIYAIKITGTPKPASPSAT